MTVYFFYQKNPQFATVWKKSGRFRIQDWLLTCAEQDINLLDINLKTNKRPTLKADKISEFIFVPSS